MRGMIKQETRKRICPAPMSQNGVGGEIKVEIYTQWLVRG